MATLLIRSGRDRGRSLTLGSGEFVIGRDKSCQIRLPSSQISRRHCVLTSNTERVTIRDLGSRNGTIVNGDVAAEEFELKTGDVIVVGPLELELVAIPGPVHISVDDAPASADAPTDIEQNIADWLASEESGSNAGDTTTHIPTIRQPAEYPARPAEETPDQANGDAIHWVFPPPSSSTFETVGAEGADIIRRWQERVEL